jgi:hypothetical protein
VTALPVEPPRYAPLETSLLRAAPARGERGLEAAQARIAAIMLQLLDTGYQEY